MRGKLLIAVIIGFLAYLASVLVRRDSMKFQRWKLMNEYIPKLGEMVGVGSKLNISRILERHFIGKYQGNKNVRVSEHVFGGTRSILYQRRGDSGGKPAIIFIHGGGWAKGQPESFSDIASELVRRLDVAVLTFDYRKAPEHVFPAGFNDCLRGLIAFSGVAESLGVDPFRLAVMGESSGGNIAAGLVGEMHRMDELRKKFSVKLLVLFNPILQALDFQLPSHANNSEQFMMTKDSLLDYWLMYITGGTSSKLRSELSKNKHVNEKAHKLAGEIIYKQLNKGKKKADRIKQKKVNINQKTVDLLKTATVDPRVSPILIPSHAIPAMPPVYLVTCQYDVVKDEAFAWRDHLLHLNARVIHNHYDFYHSILTYYSSGQLESVTAVNDFINHLLRNALL